MPARIKITADSTCDLPISILKKYNIETLPLNVLMGDNIYKDGRDITPDDIINHVKNGGELCSTSAVNAYEYEDVFKKYSKEYDSVIHITIGNEFSCCFQNANIAAAEFDNVYVVNSENLSTGQGLFTILLAELSKENDAEYCINKAKDSISKIDGSFLLETLDYMKKGGRCSSVTAFGANLLKLKLCIEVRDGKLGVVKKYRGAMKKCIEQYLSERLSDTSSIKKDRVFITHATTPEILDYTREIIEGYGIFDEIIYAHVGCTITCHCGPGTIGIFFERI